MAQGKKTSFLRGKRMRATRVDAAGRPLIGEDNAVVTKGFITVAFTTNTEEGEAITVTNANGETCVAEPSTPSFNGFSVEATFCDVDFSLFSLITGQDLVYDAAGNVIGIVESTDVDIAAVNFAMEMWLGATSSGEEGVEYGYVLLPFLSGGIVGDYSIENAAITFTLTGMKTKNGTGWGVGPYAVENVGGTPSALRTPLKANDHRYTILTTVAPPAVYAGSIPVLDPSADALTALEAAVTGKKATLTPTPASEDDVFYDFGDGQWDVSETGGFEHTYDAPGTYTVTARRGLTVKTAPVVIA